MRRFEFSDGKSNKFWEIDLDGSSYTVRYGRMGTDGQTSTKVFDSDEKAAAAAEKVIKAKTKKGYAEAAAVEREVDGNPELEAAIHADPTDLGAWQVYADWLQGEGDARGDVVAAHVAMAQKPDDEALRKNAAALHETHIKLLMGGFTEEEKEECLEVDWGMGMWKRAKVGMSWEAEDVDCVKLLGKVLRHDSAKFLERLEVGLTDLEGEAMYDAVAKSIVKHGKRPSIRAVHIGAFEYPDDTEISWAYVGNMSAIYGVLPNLEDLQITGADIGVGKLELPGLKRLKLETGGLPKQPATALAKAKLPALEKLEVWFGTEDYEGECSVEDAAAILANVKGLPKVTWLGLKNADFQNEICKAVVEGKLTAQLTHLDLSLGTMTDEGAQHLLDGAAKLAHLDVIDIDDNYVSDAMVAKLKAALPNVNEGSQDGDLDYVYVSVGE